MRVKRWTTWVGFVVTAAALFFAQGLLAVGAMETGADGSIALYVRAAFPPILLGLIAAAGLWGMGLRGKPRSVMEWLPALGIALVVMLAAGAPAFGGRYPDHEFRLPLLFWAAVWLALIGAAEAAIRGRVRGFGWRAALWPAAGMAAMCVAPAAFALYFPAQSGSVPAARAGITALYLLTGLTILPFGALREAAMRRASWILGGAYLVGYALFAGVWTEGAGWAGAVVRLCFPDQGCLALAAALACAGLIPRAKA